MTLLKLTALILFPTLAGAALPPPGPNPPAVNGEEPPSSEAETPSPSLPRIRPSEPPVRRALPPSRPAGSDPLAPIARQTGIEFGNEFFQIAESSPTRWRSSRTAWMDRRWRLDKGMIGDRYLDRNFGALPDFSSRYRYVSDDTFLDIARRLAHRGLPVRSELSPAEKYDLLVGDTEGNLTRRMWQESKSFDDSHSITSWMALCDGSAAASVAVPEARRSVMLPSGVDGQPIHFYPYDIKALATLFYSAISLRNLPIVGGRCRGDLSSRECEEPGPEILYRLLTQLSGQHNEIVMMDRTAGAPVWNSPILSYELRYFQPITRIYKNDPRQAVVPLSQWTSDPFRRERSPRAQNVVGIRMIVEYTGPASEEVSYRPPNVQSLTYQFELELDSAGELVGGQWETNQRPDFFWTVDTKNWPRTLADARLRGESWKEGAVPRSWLPAAQESSAAGQPLRKVLSQLLEWSKD